MFYYKKRSSSESVKGISLIHKKTRLSSLLLKYENAILRIYLARGIYVNETSANIFLEIMGQQMTY